MHFNAYSHNAGLLAAALANVDDEANADAVENLLAEHWVARARLTDRQLDALRSWRVRLWEVFDAAEMRDKLSIVNGLLRESVSRPYISTHDGHAPHLHYVDEDADVVARVKAVTAAGIAYVLTASDPECAPGSRVK